MWEREEDLPAKFGIRVGLVAKPSDFECSCAIIMDTVVDEFVNDELWFSDWNVWSLAFAGLSRAVRRLGSLPFCSVFPATGLSRVCRGACGVSIPGVWLTSTRCTRNAVNGSSEEFMTIAEQGGVFIILLNAERAMRLVFQFGVSTCLVHLNAKVDICALLEVLSARSDTFVKPFLIALLGFSQFAFGCSHKFA